VARTVVVLAGGDPPVAPPPLPPADLVVAADGGAARAAPLGLTVDVVVGDLDSIAPDHLDELRAAGARVEAHHPDKDATDLDLALATALRTLDHGAEGGARTAAGVAADADVNSGGRGEPGRVVLVGGHGGRLDHHLATFAALAAVAAPGRRIEAWLGAAQVLVVADRREVPGRPGELVSLLALGGPVSGVTTEGLRWPLVDFDLPSTSTLGVSNEIVTSPTSVSVTGGVLAVVRPHALTPERDEPRRVPDRAS